MVSLLLPEASVAPCFSCIQDENKYLIVFAAKTIRKISILILVIASEWVCSEKKIVDKVIVHRVLFIHM